VKVIALKLAKMQLMNFSNESESQSQRSKVTLKRSIEKMHASSVYQDVLCSVAAVLVWRANPATVTYVL